jgi:hypothetical protein
MRSPQDRGHWNNRRPNTIAAHLRPFLTSWQNHNTLREKTIIPQQLMNRHFRKYHRTLAPIIFLPLGLSILTGMAMTMDEEWSLNLGIPRRFLLGLHTGEIFHLQGIYPMLNGLGLLGLLVTGISMTGLFKGKKVRPPNPES